jgi:hypothetical protein
VVKDCWPEIIRDKEEDILQDLKGVSSVPPMLHQAGSDRFDTPPKIRRGFEKYVQYHFAQQGYATAPGGSKPGASSTHNMSQRKDDKKRKRQEGEESHVTRKRSRRTGT